MIEPDRAELVARIDRRFDGMVEAGALRGGAGAVGAAASIPALPAVKAIGVRELQAALAGEMALDEAINRAKIATRQYAKRQSTWFRNQVGSALAAHRAGRMTRESVGSPGITLNAQSRNLCD